MEDKEFINLWKTYDDKLAENLVLNKQHAERITQMEVRSYLSSMKPGKLFAIVAGVLWVGFVDGLIIRFLHVATPWFLISAGIQAVLSTLAIAVYVYQLTLISQVDISDPILATQEKLSRLKSSTLWITRLLFLQMPVWTTFYWNKSMFASGNIWLWALQIVVTLAVTFIGIWLFTHIKYENRGKKWFRVIFSGKEWIPILKSMELLNQIDEYRANDGLQEKN